MDKVHAEIVEKIKTTVSEVEGNNNALAIV